MVSEEEKIYFEAAKKLAELAKYQVEPMISELESKDAEYFHIHASDLWGRTLGRAKLMCELVAPENEQKCLVPVMEVEKEVIARLKEAFKG